MNYPFNKTLKFVFISPARLQQNIQYLKADYPESALPLCDNKEQVSEFFQIPYREVENIILHHP